MEADLTAMDKWRGIYGAERWVMDPDCDHGAALVTSQSCIIDIVVKYEWVCVCGGVSWLRFFREVAYL